MSKNTTTPKGEGANTPKAEQPKTSPVILHVVNQEQSQEQTPEELKREIERLKAQLSKSPETFDDLINYYQRKQELISQLQQLENTHGIIKQHLQVTTKEHNDEIFSSENYSLVIMGKKQGGYGEGEILKFKNPSVITDLLSYVLGKVQAKMNEIQFEISQ
jgi:predicted Zn-dependent peptidase